jgi:hypothetical protein
MGRPLKESSKSLVDRLRAICVSVVLVGLLFGRSSHAQNDKIAEAVDRIRSTAPSVQRTEAARSLFDLTRNGAGRNTSDAEIASLISLLDDKDISVEYWVAGTLGNIGFRAKSAIPHLNDLLRRTECQPLEKSPADAARYALKRMKARITSGDCSVVK